MKHLLEGAARPFEVLVIVVGCCVWEGQTGTFASLLAVVP